MGRRADPPAVQQAKGNPGRRVSKVEKRRAEASRVAELLAASLANASGVEAPAMIAADPTAAAMWRDLAPTLMKTHRLQQQHRPLFFAFCVYYAEWVLAKEAVDRDGHVTNVRTVSGSMMPRTHPMVRIRDDALKNALELSKRFGLTPADEYSLFKDQAVAAATNPGLFGALPTQRPGDEPPVQQSGGVIGKLSQFDTPPPGSRPN
jgi:P27 family predicted phage terminase small subunit